MKEKNFIPKREGTKAKERGEKKEGQSFTEELKNNNRRKKLTGINEKAEEIERLANEIKIKLEEENTRAQIEEGWEEDKQLDKEAGWNAYESQKEIERVANESYTEKDFKKIKELEPGWSWKKIGKGLGRVASYIPGAFTTTMTLFGVNSKANATEVNNNAKDKTLYAIHADAIEQKQNINDEGNYIVDPSRDLQGGGDGDKTEKEIIAQQKHDAEVTAKHEKLWEANHHYYVRDGKDLESVIRHSLGDLKDDFKDSRDLRNSVDQIYDGVLTQKELADLDSFIQHGHSFGHDGSVDRKDVEELQTILTKIASAPSDKINDKLTDILNENGGIDNKAGIKTAEALNNLIIEKVGHVLEIAGAKTPELNTEKVQANLGDMEKVDTPDLRGYTSITLESGLIFQPDEAQDIKLITEKVNGLGDFNEIGDFVKHFNSSDFDKINITGSDTGNGVEYKGDAVDFDTLDKLGSGKYMIDSGKYHFNFEYDRQDGGHIKTIKDFSAIYHGEHGDITVSASEAEKNINGFDQNDPNSEGYTRSLKDFKLNAFGKVEFDIGNLHKYETSQEVGGSVNNVHIKIGEWSLSADQMSGKYKTPDGNFDLGKMIDNVWQDKDGARIGDLINRFDVSSGPIKIENASGTVHLEYDGHNLKYNDYNIFKDADGNYNMIDSHGQGAKYDGGFETYTKINGKNIETGAFINNLVYGGATEMIGANTIETGVSVMNGFVEIKTGDVHSHITPEVLASYRTDINETTQRISDQVNNFTKNMGSGNASDLLHSGLALKTEVLNELGGLMHRVAEKGDITMKDWEFKADFKTLAENFKLIGSPDAASAVYKIDTFLGALGNDLGTITINQEVVDGYKLASNKADFVCEHVWGKNVKELENDFISRAEANVGAKLLEQPTEKIMSVMNAIDNGSVEGLVLSPDELQMYYNFSKQLHSEGTNFIVYANANLSEKSQDQEVYANLVNTDGKEHLETGAHYQDFGGVGLLATHVVFDNHEKGTMVKAMGGLNLEFAKINDFSVGFTDGQGHHYNVIDGDNFFKVAKQLTGEDNTFDIMQKAIHNKCILPVPQAELGFDITQGIIGKHGGKTTLEGSVMAATNYFNTSLNLSLRAEKDLSNLTGLPLTVGGKLDTNLMLNGGSHKGPNGEVFIRYDLGKSMNRYVHHHK